jgi:hypothetical protein
LEATVAAHGVVMARANVDKRDQMPPSSRDGLNEPDDGVSALQLVPSPARDGRRTAQMPLTFVAEDKPRLNADAAVILARLVRERLANNRSGRSPARRFGLVIGEGEAHCDP